MSDKMSMENNNRYFRSYKVNFKSFQRRNQYRGLSFYFTSFIQEVNQNTSDWIEGHVTRIAENGWGTLQPEDGTSTLSIQPIMVTNNKLSEGDKLKVRFELSQDETKRHIKEIIKI